MIGFVAIVQRFEGSGFRVGGRGFTSNLDHWRIRCEGRVHGNGTIRGHRGMAAAPRADLQGLEAHKEG